MPTQAGEPAWEYLAKGSVAMGEPEVATIDNSADLLLSLLSPRGVVDGSKLVKAGLHRLVMRQYFDAIRPEIKNMVGWRPLQEFVYAPHWRETTKEDTQQGEKRTAQWRRLLEEEGIASEMAIQIFDGEKMRQPAPDYRLFLLRDGRLLHYAGGFNAVVWEKPVLSYGEPLAVLDAMGDGYGSFGRSSAWYSFMIIMGAMNKALETAIRQRERMLDEQRTLHAQLVQLVQRIQ